MQKMRKCLHAKNAQMSSYKKCGNVFMQKMRKCLHAKYSLFLSDFKRTFNFLERFSKNNQLNATKIRLFFEPSSSMWTEGRTDRQIRRRQQSVFFSKFCEHAQKVRTTVTETCAYCDDCLLSECENFRMGTWRSRRKLRELRGEITFRTIMICGNPCQQLCSADGNTLAFLVHLIINLLSLQHSTTGYLCSCWQTTVLCSLSIQEQA